MTDVQFDNLIKTISDNGEKTQKLSEKITNFQSQITAEGTRISHIYDRIQKMDEKNIELFHLASQQAENQGKAIENQGKAITTALDRITKLEAIPPKTWKDAAKTVALGGVGALAIVGGQALYGWLTSDDSTSVEIQS